MKGGQKKHMRSGSFLMMKLPKNYNYFLVKQLHSASMRATDQKKTAMWLHTEIEAVRDD